MSARIPDRELVLAALEAEYASHVDVHVFEALDSTSAWLGVQRELMRNQLEQGRAQLCVTDWQQAGVGRRGKSWQTQPGNITFSLLSRHDQAAQNLLGLSLITGIAVAETLNDAVGLKVMLKWPNDVMLNNRKLGGLLTEVMTVSAHKRQASASAETSSSPCTDVITGIGINVQHDESVTGLGIGATSLKQAGVELCASERDALIGRLGAAVLRSHQVFLERGWSAFCAQWDTRDWLKGKDVLIHHENKTEQAVARGVNGQGALLVESAGKVTSLYGGNVSIRPAV